MKGFSSSQRPFPIRSGSIQNWRKNGLYTRTIEHIREIFPMYELTLDGLEKAVTYMMRKN